MGRVNTINYALAATLLTTGATYEEIAPKVGAKNGESLRVGLGKRLVTKTGVKTLSLPNCRTTHVAIQVASEASQILKEQMSGLLEQHTGALAQVKVKADLKHITRVGQALEPLARTAKIVHGWGDESVSGLISIGVVEQLQRPGCGVDTPTGSAQELNQNTQAPQLSEVIDVQSSTEPAN
jgi:hypothetical protein